MGTHEAYGYVWSPWKLWSGDNRYGPANLMEELVYVRRRSSSSDYWRVDEAHHIDWFHTGGPHDVVMYCVEAPERGSE